MLPLEIPCGCLSKHSSVLTWARSGVVAYGSAGFSGRRDWPLQARGHVRRESTHDGTSKHPRRLTASTLGGFEHVWILAWDVRANCLHHASSSRIPRKKRVPRDQQLRPLFGCTDITAETCYCFQTPVTTGWEQLVQGSHLRSEAC